MGTVTPSTPPPEYTSDSRQHPIVARPVKRKTSLILGGVLIVSVVLFAGFMIYHSTRPTLYTIEGNGDNVIVTFNPKYNVLVSPDPSQYKKPWCATLADSRAVRLDSDKNKTTSVMKLRDAEKEASAQNDTEAAQFFALLANETEKFNFDTPNLPSPELENASAKVAEIASTNCGLVYFSTPNPDLVEEVSAKIKKNQKNNPPPAPDTTESSPSALTSGELSEAQMQSIYVGTITIPVDPSLYTLPYCTVLGEGVSRFPSAARAREVDTVLFDTINSTLPTLPNDPSLIEAYTAVQRSAGNGPFTALSNDILGVPTSPDTVPFDAETYNKSISTISAASTAQCGIDLSRLKVQQ